MSSAPAASASFRPSPWAHGLMLVQPMFSSSTTSAHTPVLTSWRYAMFAPKPPVQMTTDLAFTTTSCPSGRTPFTPTTAPPSTISSVASQLCRMVTPLLAHQLLMERM